MSMGSYGAEYLGHERWLSYVAQINAVRDLRPRSVAEIGVGPRVVGNMVRATYPGSSYTSIDIQAELEPDVCASVTDLPFPDRAFDVTYCCQVLEHLPFDMFGTALAELRRVTDKRVVVSLPDVTPFFFLRFRGSRRFLPWLWRGFDLPNPRPRQHDYATHGQHYWEIGAKDYPVRRILDAMTEQGLVVRDHYRMVERPYWHFFLLDVPQ